MPEYYLRIIGKEITIKRMVAESDDIAMRAAIQWEGQNPDMDLTCGVRRIAVRRKSVWLLRPDAGYEDDEEFSREAIDSFTVAVGWAGSMRREIDRVEVRGTARAQKTESKKASSPKRRPWDWLRRLRRG